MSAENGNGLRTDYRPRPVVDPAQLAAEIAKAAAVPRKALGLEEAATSLGVSTDYFKEHIAPELRIVRRGRRKLVPVTELDRWLDAAATFALDPEG
jgi:hypothetical protein